MKQTYPFLTTFLLLFLSLQTSFGQLSLVKDINSGEIGSTPTSLVDVNGTLFFLANESYSPTYSVELWKSNGTNGGTTLIKYFSGPVSSLTNFNGKLAFKVQIATKLSLWISDGSSLGTTEIKQFSLGTNYLLATIDDKLFFSADDGTQNGVFVSDGTPSGTQLIASGISIAKVTYKEVYDIVKSNGIIYFNGSGGMYTTNGTAVGTNIISGMPAGTTFNHLTDVNGTLFMKGVNLATSTELWKSNGTGAGTVMVKDIYACGSTVCSSDPRELFNMNGVLYFTAISSNEGRELWKSDGTDAGTVLVKNICDLNFYSNPGELTKIQNTLYLTANNTPYGSVGNGIEIWKSDGTDAGTILIKDVFPGTNSGSGSLRNYHDTIFFIGGNETGAKLWYSTGSEAKTQMVSPAGPNNISYLTVSGDVLYFTSNDGALGTELWRYQPGALIPNGTITQPAENSTITALTEVLLQWSLENSNNIIIEYSTDYGMSWNTIVSNLPSNNQRTAAIESGQYNWSVPNITESSIIVRLRDYQKGTELHRTNYSVSAATGIFSSSKHATAKIYPNPSNGIIFIEADHSAVLTVSNSLGKIIHTEAVNNTSSLDVSHWQKGIYIFKLMKDEHLQISKVIID